jgi:hypothetical protein
MGILPNNRADVNTPDFSGEPCPCRFSGGAFGGAMGISLRMYGYMGEQVGLSNHSDEETIGMGEAYNPSLDNSSSTFRCFWVSPFGVFTMTLMNPSPRPRPLKWGNP